MSIDTQFHLINMTHMYVNMCVDVIITLCVDAIIARMCCTHCNCMLRYNDFVDSVAKWTHHDCKCNIKGTVRVVDLQICHCNLLDAIPHACLATVRCADKETR